MVGLYISRTRNEDFYFSVYQARPQPVLDEPHKHDFLQIFYVLSGSFRHIANGKAHIHAKNELLILPPYMTHQIDTRDASDVEWIIINIGEGFLGLSPDETARSALFDLICLRPLIYHSSHFSPFLRFEGKELQHFEQILTKLQNEHSSSCCTLPFIRSGVSQLLSLITQQYIATAKTRDNSVITGYRMSLQIAMEYIDSHFTQQITREEICRIAHMSKSSFSYIFKQLTGQTLTEYINSHRIHLAKQLLEERKKNFTQIGELCGFSSLIYFSRVFKKCTGLSPRDYLRTLDENLDI